MATMDPRDSIPLTLLPLAVIARESGYSISTVQNWASGEQLCPPGIAGWLARRAEQMRVDPMPRKGSAEAVRVWDPDNGESA